MFCYRIAEWNLQKNSKSPTQKDLLRLVRQYEKQVLKGQSIYILERPRQESSDQSSASQSSRDDDDQKDITHSGKILQSLLQDLRHRTLVYSKPVNPLLLPHQLRQAEMILKQTDIYYSTLFIPLKISQHDDDIRAGMLAEDMIVSPWDFCNTMDSAFELFNLGQLREAFVLLEDASQMTRPMLAGNHSETLQSLLFNAADWSNSAPPDIFRILWRYLAEMAAIVLGRESPICVVCKAILGMESGGGSLVYENAFRLILGKLGGELGERHKQTLRARDKYNTLVSLTGDLETVERLQKELVQQYEGPLLFSVDGVWAVYALGEIQHRKGDFAAAEETLREALRLSRIFSGDGFPSQIDISIIHSLATAIMERNEYNECEALMREALETCLRNEERGAERDWRTPKILGDLTWILGKAGKEKEVERLKEEYPGAFVEKVPGATK
jgi:tetratricopeptide (TPR) repeat protein